MLATSCSDFQFGDHSQVFRPAIKRRPGLNRALAVASCWKWSSVESWALAVHTSAVTSSTARPLRGLEFIELVARRRLQCERGKSVRVCLTEYCGSRRTSAPDLTSGLARKTG